MIPELGTLLYRGYRYGNKLLDLYGDRPAEDHGYIVTTATFIGTQVCLAYLLGDEKLEEMGCWLDAQLVIERAEERAEVALHDRQMALSDHLWRSL